MTSFQCYFVPRLLFCFLLAMVLAAGVALVSRSASAEIVNPLGVHHLEFSLVGNKVRPNYRGACYFEAKILVVPNSGVPLPEITHRLVRVEKGSTVPIFYDGILWQTYICRNGLIRDIEIPPPPPPSTLPPVPGLPPFPPPGLPPVPQG